MCSVRGMTTLLQLEPTCTSYCVINVLTCGAWCCVLDVASDFDFGAGVGDSSLDGYCCWLICYCDVGVGGRGCTGVGCGGDGRCRGRWWWCCLGDGPVRLTWPLPAPSAVGGLAVGRWPWAVGRWPLAVGRWCCNVM